MTGSTKTLARTIGKLGGRRDAVRDGFGGSGIGLIQPLEDLDLELRRRLDARRLGRRHPLDLGELGEQSGGVAGVPVDRAGEPQVVGQVLGPSPWRRSSASVQASTARSGAETGLELDGALQAGDRLAVGAQPGQAERPVVPGGRVGRFLRRQPAEGVGHRREVRGAGPLAAVALPAPASTTPPMRPRSRSSQAARRAASAGGRSR